MNSIHKGIEALVVLCLYAYSFFFFFLFVGIIVIKRALLLYASAIKKDHLMGYISSLKHYRTFHFINQLVVPLVYLKSKN